MKTSQLMLRMAVYVVLGAPLVWVVWEAVNALLSGQVGEVNWIRTLPALLLLIGLLVLLGRSATKLDGAASE